MPRRTMFSVVLPSIRWPSKRTSPEVLTMAQTARSVVVLPAPLAPRMVVMPPASTAKRSPWSTLVLPYCAWRSAASRIAGTGSVLAAEIRADDLGIALHLDGRALGDLPAEVEHH